MKTERIHLTSYFGFSKVPFTKYMWSKKMFDASSQRELIDGLHFWLETKGIALLCGPPGVGKSISLRKFKEELDDRRYDLFYLFNQCYKIYYHTIANNTFFSLAQYAGWYKMQDMALIVYLNSMSSIIAALVSYDIVGIFTK